MALITGDTQYARACALGTERAMRYQRIIAMMLLAFAPVASAFNMGECITLSQAEPYAMSVAEAHAACAAKNSASGEADTRRTADSVPIKRPDVGADAVKERVRSYMRKGYIKAVTCISLCRNKYPLCPVGYTLLKPAAGPYINGAYHGRYWLRSAACLKD